jgi:hypothetical protein
MDFKEERSFRNHNIKVNYSKEEFDNVKKRATALGIKVASYLRLVSLNAKINIE